MKLPNMNEARIRTKNPVDVKNFVFDEKYKNIVKDKYYFVKTYGCQMNERDSENISALLEMMGYTKSDKMKDADVIILNTCSIRENANNKVFGMLGRIKNMKQTKKDLIVGMTGCMAQEEHICNEILNKYRWMNFVVGTHNFEKIVEKVYEAVNKPKLDIEVLSCEGNVLEDLPSIRTSKYKVFVNIQLGCDKFCTYCIVPYTRGKQRSRKKEDILKEIKTLVHEGYQEVTLLGQNVNAYGKDLYDDYELSDLLVDVSKTNIPRIRFITSHPWDFSDKLIEVIKEHKNILNYVHLPIQSGSNRILKLMGRRYTKESYKELYDKLRSIENISVTTDIIVGFPGETEEDFQDTLDMVNYCKYDSAFTFIYSPRENTPASRLEDNTPLSVKEERLYCLNDLVNKYSKESNLKMLNNIYEVLVEGESTKAGMLFGYTETNKLINFKADKELIGSIVKVKIIDAKSFSLDGELVE